MSPIVVRATLAGAIMLPEHAIALDALLVAAYAIREDLRVADDVPIPADAIPLRRSDCGRIYLASEGQYEVEAHERRYLNRRFPVAEAQALGSPKVKRINLSAGATKGYRIPQQTLHLVEDVMTWYAVGAIDGVRELIALIGYLGKKRSVGLGRVASWSVEPIEPWEGFPVLRDGRPLRSLPLDWPGLGEHRIENRVLTPPYFERWREQECAVA